MGRIFVRAAGLVLGTGVAALAGTGVASAQPASSSTACQQVQATLSSIQSTLPQAASNPSALSSKIGTFVSQLEQEASSGPPALQSAVSTFVTDLKAAGSGNINVAKLTSDGNAIGAACTASQVTAPGGAPATGGGSAAGSRDPLLFGLGGAAVLAGAGVLGLARRSRLRSDTAPRN
jgi:hypothetical protein